MSGTDRIVAAAAAMWATDPGAWNLGVELVEAGPEGSLVRLEVTAAMVNGAGVCHGGYLFAVADTALAFAACAALGRPAVTDRATILYLGAVAPGTTLEARGRVRVRRGRTVVLEVSVTTGDGDVVVLLDGTAVAPREGAADR